jgi:hypothetical protein
MIKANELRIGNWVQYDDGTTMLVDGILQSDVSLEGFPIVVGLSVIRPIPLTPEVLEKCGFKKHDDNPFFRMEFAYHDSSYPCYLIYDIEKDYIQVCRNFTSAADAPCKYLHQLQNLYFALTNTELTINLK